MIKGEKYLISCSSGNIEYYNLINEITNNVSYVNKRNPFPNLLYTNSDGSTSLTIINSGFPVNFDRSKESVPAKQIQLTRGLILGGILQGLRLLNQKTTLTPISIMLSPEIQLSVIRSCKKQGLFDNIDVGNIFSNDWICDNSDGNNF